MHFEKLYIFSYEMHFEKLYFSADKSKNKHIFFELELRLSWIYSWKITHIKPIMPKIGLSCKIHLYKYGIKLPKNKKMFILSCVEKIE